MRNLIAPLALQVCALLFCLFHTSLHGQSPQSTSDFPAIYNSETSPAQPLTPQQALNSLQLPAGFSATVFAAEPDVQNPIAADVDPSGRIWVAENYTYAERSQRFDLSLRDRVVVLEDFDGDGVSDKRTVFKDDIQMLTGLVVGQGGLWLMCPPQLLFVPDADGDLIPDGPAQVRLDGFHVARENYHNFANGLSWGPDSWLYGRCGASCPGELGLPGATDQQRVPLRGGIWRFHPQRRIVEVLNQGTTNPWGHDWNELGELFFINTVNGHLWHSICGAHYVRPHSLDANPHCYQQIDMHADHWHFDTGKSWTDSRDGAANDFGGGHAHVGMLIYQETSWPSEYRNRLMTFNMHGRRVNTERLEPQGSGFVGRHDQDILLTDDVWFRGMDLLPTPDGNVLLLDWADTGECHDSTGVHRTSGRIFKITFGSSQPAPHQSNPLRSDQIRHNPAALAEVIRDGNEWHSRHARQLLRSMTVQRIEQHSTLDSERPAEDPGQWQQAEQILLSLLESHPDPRQRLRGLWGLWAMDRLTAEQCISLLDDEQPALQSWALRRLSDSWPLDTTIGTRPSLSKTAVTLPSTDSNRWQHNLGFEDAPDSLLLTKLVALAAGDDASSNAHGTDASVRLTLSSTLQRLPIAQRAALATALMNHREDAQDHNLPMMVWYGLIPLGATEQLAVVAAQSQWPLTRQLMARRLAEVAGSNPQPLERLIELSLQSNSHSLARDIILGTAKGLAGRRRVDMPKGWTELQTLIDADRAALDRQNIQQAQSSLNVLFGDGVAIEELKRVAADKQSDLDQRLLALQSLVDSRAEGLRDLCLDLLSQRYLNVVAARGLANESDAAVGSRLIATYRSFAPLDRPTVISVLCSRKVWGLQLLQALADKLVDRTEITPFQARQLSSFQDPELDALLAEHWGIARPSDAQRAAQMKDLRKFLTPTQLLAADPGKGRSLFNRLCGACHTMYGQGGTLGPDLTGAQRNNMDYLLENIVDPSAVVNKEFRATIIMLEDGRVLTGLVTERNEQTITLATQELTLHIAVEEISQIKLSAASTMPEGLLGSLNAEQLADLFSYLQSSQ